MKEYPRPMPSEERPRRQQNFHRGRVRREGDAGSRRCSVSEDRTKGRGLVKGGAERAGKKAKDSKNGERDGRKQTLVNEAHQSRLKRFPAAV